MNEMKLKLLHELLSKVVGINDEKELEAVTGEFSAGLASDGSTMWNTVIDDVRNIGVELITLRVNADSKKRSAVRTEQERAELAEVRRLIDENLFDYHFQPIVSAVDGEIYSYEALMRPKSSLCPSPYHVIKYAEIMERLDDIERATFLNVLGIIDSNKDAFGTRKVFINSIPRTRLDNENFERIKYFLEKHSGSVVVEMTEQSEMVDGEFCEIREMYDRLNVKVAIDDYGTGYSNVHNLLSYMPDYVKIDRSLLSDIQNNSKKRYFVREIVDFCHDNGILALAEGVETSEELQMVIKLGVDLVQGYYTARPSAVILESIPREIRKEIKRYRQEREDGKKLQIYNAGKSERVLLERMEKDGYRCVHVGMDGSGDVTVAGSLELDAKLYIDVANDFCGCIILDNVILSNEKKRPCISIGDNCVVDLVLTGNNQLKNGGIRVPESSKLTVKGDGGLSIFIDGSGFYAIGNDGESAHGELVFEQGVTIDNHAASGVGIGSGLGGKINIHKGQFSINMAGYMGVGIGAFNADADLELYACDVTVELASQLGTAIGSLEGNCRVNVHHSALKLYMSGTDIVGIGTLNGRKCDVVICEASTKFNIISNHCSAIAALDGATRFSLERAGMHIVIRGDNALAIGGYSGDTELALVNSDTSVDMITKLDYNDYVKMEKIEKEGGRARVVVNRDEIRSE